MTNITLTLEQRVHKVELNRAQNSIALTFPQRLHKVVLNPTGIQAPGGGGITDGDKGDLTVSAGGEVWTINDAVVTDAKIVSLSWGKITDVPATFASTIALVAGLQDALDGKQDDLGFTPEDAAQKGVPGGYAALDGAGKLNPSTLPAIAVTDTFVVASQAAMLALTAETGDVAVRTDVSRSFILRGADPAILANWVELATPTDTVASIFGRTGVVTAQLGDYTTAQVTESGNLYFTEARARAVPLTGYAAAGSRTALAAADTILGAFAKIGKWLSDLAAVAFSGSASDLTQGTLPVARIADGSLALGKLASLATSTILGRATAGTGAPEALTPAQVTGLLDTFTSGAKGLVPASGGGTANFLRADGTWAAPPGGGAGAVPGGAINEMQVNDGAGGFAGVPGALNEGGQLRLPIIAPPAVPAAGGIKMFARNVGGRAMPAFMGPSGLDSSLAPHLGRNKVGLFLPPGNSTTAQALGLAVATAGTATQANFGTSSLHTIMRRIDYLVTTASTSAVAFLRAAQGQWLLGGPSAGLGGFHMIYRWAPATGVTNAQHRAFAGLRATTTAPTDVNPSTLTSIVGMGYDSADANVQFMHNDGSGTATKIDLGSAFPKPTADRSVVYEIAMFAPPGATQILNYEVTELTSGAVATGTVTTDIPSTTTALAPWSYVSVGGVSSVVGITIFSLYIETDY